MILQQHSKFSVTFADSPVLRFAAEELSHYLSAALKMEQGEGVAFRLSVEPDTVERFTIAIGESITVTGSNERSVLYGVYEFLERYVGCCFGAMRHPTENIGETVPELAALELPEETFTHTADLPYRTAIVQFDVWAGEADRGLTLPFFDWLAKNRYNRLLLWVSCYEKLKSLGWLDELKKRGFDLTVGHHQAIFTFLPPYGNEHFATAYRDEHPEYFRMLENGERFTPTDLKNYNGQWLLCSRNEECVQTIADNILYWLEQNPLVDTIAFWPNDGKKPDCCCPACAPYSKTENYLYFNSALAARIAQKRPDVKIDTLIYMDLWNCPAGTDLDDHIVIDIAMCTDTFRPYGQKDGGNVLGTTYEDNLRAFRGCTKNVVAYEYYMGNFAAQQKVMPAADEMQSIFSAMKDGGISGSGTQIECFNHWNNLFNFYCFGRSAFDTSLSVEDQIERFARLFGKGGDKIKDILRLYERTMEGQVPIHYGGTFLVENIDKEALYALFEDALAAADTPRERNNVRLLRMAFRYSELIVSDPVTLQSSKPVHYEDPTGELSFMGTHFDSYYAHHTGYGIALPIANRTDAPAPDHWYEFE